MPPCVVLVAKGVCSMEVPVTKNKPTKQGRIQGEAWEPRASHQEGASHQYNRGKITRLGDF